jgi:hypothetical protein
MHREHHSEIMSEREIVQCIFGIMDAHFPCKPPSAERVRGEFILRGFENVVIRNDGCPEKFTVFGSLGSSGCRSDDELITAVCRIALALHVPILARESLYSVYGDERFRVIITLKNQ